MRRQSGKACGEAHYASKLTAADVLAIRERAAAGDRLKAIAADYPQVSKVSVHHAIHRNRWTSVEPQPAARPSHDVDQCSHAATTNAANSL